MENRPDRKHGFSVYPPRESVIYYPFLACCNSLKEILARDYNGEVIEISRSYTSSDNRRVYILMFVIINGLERNFIASVNYFADTIEKDTLEYGEIVTNDSDVEN